MSELDTVVGTTTFDLTFTLYHIGSTIIFSLQLIKLKHKGVDQPAPDHKASERQRSVSNWKEAVKNRFSLLFRCVVTLIDREGKIKGGLTWGLYEAAVGN